MKKRNIFILVSLFSLSLLASCKPEGDDPFDDMFDTSSSSSNKVQINLKEYTETNYVLDNNSSNEFGSMSYEIFVRSFYDSDGDGVGDFNGIREKLPYLKELGLKTLWLMPIHNSPSYHGYDVIDYYGVHPDYGTLGDFESLVYEAQQYNIDIMIDIVFNHSSSRNNWFIQSYEDFISNNVAEGSKKDWYCWSETSKGGYSKYNNAYYEARFDSSMPDFNTKNQEVRDEFIKILKYWIDIGVKGFRFDAVKYFDYENTVYNAEFLSYIADTIKAYDPSVYFVGECWANSTIVNNYYKSTFDSFFKFSSSLEGTGDDTILGQVKGSKSSLNFAKSIQSLEATMKENNPNAYSSYFLANHDTDRASNSFTGNYAKMAASTLALMPGTPFMYYGEEIQLKGKRITNPEDLSDARRRLPMIWSATNKDGECVFPEANRPDLANNDQVKEGVEEQLATNYSLLNHYKKAINIRNKYPFIKQSVFTELTSLIGTQYEHVLVYKLSLGDDYIIVVHNYESSNVEIDVSSFAKEIVDEVSVVKLKPELKDGKLRLGRLSTVVLK